MDFVIVGGGCYGAFHVRNLHKARLKGMVDYDHLVVVDRNRRPPGWAELRSYPRVVFVQADWSEFLQGYLPSAPAGDQLVPAPLAPHLLHSALVRILARENPGVALGSTALPWDLHLPFQRQSREGHLLISAASWVCPAACIEPDVCPALRTPRGWDLATTLVHGLGPHLDFLEVLQCRHLVHGVGTIPIRAIGAALRDLRDRVPLCRPKEVLRGAIATVSHCHGVVGGVSLTRAVEPAPLATTFLRAGHHDSPGGNNPWVTSANTF